MFFKSPRALVNKTHFHRKPSLPCAQEKRRMFLNKTAGWCGYACVWPLRHATQAACAASERRPRPLTLSHRRARLLSDMLLYISSLKPRPTAWLFIFLYATQQIDFTPCPMLSGIRCSGYRRSAPRLHFCSQKRFPSGRTCLPHQTAAATPRAMAGWRMDKRG